MLSSSLGKVCQVQFERHTVLGAIKDFSGPSEIEVGLEFSVWRDSSEKLLEMKLPVVSCGRALSSLVLNTLTKAIHEAEFPKTIHTSPLRYIREGTQSWNLEAETETRAREQMFSTCGSTHLEVGRPIDRGRLRPSEGTDTYTMTHNSRKITVTKLQRK